MCGVAGILALGSRTTLADRDDLRSMLGRMAARGPDGAGEWFSPDGRIALGHRRLSIIDLSDGGRQPMLGEDGAVAICFNGEIYNYRELRSGLESRGRVFRTQSDTEVLLHLYAEKGEAMLQDLRGMFAFALWDSHRQRLMLARDPFGIKPLYYSESAGCLRFASQVKALLEVTGATSPSAAGHAGFMIWGSVPEPWTLYSGILALPAGHTLFVDSDGVGSPKAYCQISDVIRSAARDPVKGTRRQALESIAAAIHDSVAAHHVADVPVGIFLSAGLDSCLIASSAARHGNRPHTLTLGFREFNGTEHDEAPLAEQVAATIGTSHRTEITSREDFEGELEKLLAAMDQPSIDGVNTWFVSRAAAKLGLKVALSGLGGDELFASYPSFRQVPELQGYCRVFGSLPGLGKGIRQVAAPFVGRFTSPKYAGLAEYGHTLGGAYLLRRCLFAPWELPSVMDPDMARAGWSDLDTLGNLERTVRDMPSKRLAVSALELEWYTRNQLLRDADWAGMAHSLEIRVPLLDVELFRRTIPWFRAFPDISKPELAAIVAPDLPPSLLARRKTGFSVPVRDWIRPAGPGTHSRGLRGWAEFVHGQFAGSAA